MGIEGSDGFQGKRREDPLSVVAEKEYKGGGDLIIDYKLTLPMRGKVHMNITKPYRGIKQIISGLSHIPLNPAPLPPSQEIIMIGHLRPTVNKNGKRHR